jgi:hypothetical protein
MVGWLRLAIATRQGAAAASKLMRREQAAIHRVVQQIPPAEACVRVRVCAGLKTAVDGGRYG